MLPFRSLAYILLLPVVSLGAEAFHFPVEKLSPSAQLHYISGLPVLVVEGSPEEIGTGVGKLAVKPSERALNYPRDLLRAFKADSMWDLIVQGGKGMYRQFPQDYRQELEAMARGAGVDLERLIVGNTMFDLKKVFACSALLVEAERSATGGPLLGRNLDYPSLGYIHQHSLVTVYRPQGKHAFVSVGFPGLVGCLSGMNDAGLSLAVLEVGQTREGEPTFNALGIPYALCFRKLLEECTTIDQAYEMLSKLPRTVLLNLVVADRESVAVFEITPGKVVRREAVNGAAPCTNHFCHAAVRPDSPVNVARTRDRFQRLESLASMEKKLGPEEVHQGLHAVNLGRLTLQTMVFEPRTLRLHLAVGEIPASQAAFRVIELAPLLKGEKQTSTR